MGAIIDLKSLQHFVLAAEECNFARAAARANLTQTPFGRSIQSLEEVWGLRLFDRTTRSVRLTPMGEQVLMHARSLLAHARCFGDEVRDLAGAVGGTLAFGASQFAVDTVLPGILADFHASHPRVKIDVSVGHWDALIQQLQRGQLEFVVAFPGSLPQRGAFRLIELPSQPASLFCRRGHPLLTPGHAGVLAKNLLDYPWGSLEISDTTVDSIRSAMGLPDTVALPFVMNCSSKELLLETLLTSNLVVASWSAWLGPHLESGEVVDLGTCLEPPIPPQHRIARCSLIERSDRTLSPLARLLKDRIVPRALPAPAAIGG